MSAILVVTPDEYQELLSAHDRATATIDGRLDEATWITDVRRIFGGELTDQMIQVHRVSIVVEYGDPVNHFRFSNTSNDAETAP